MKRRDRDEGMSLDFPSLVFRPRLGRIMMDEANAEGRDLSSHSHVWNSERNSQGRSIKLLG